MRCPHCSAETADSSRFCPSCGEAVGSPSEMPTGLATPSAIGRSAAAPRLRTPSSSGIGRLASSDAIDSGGFAPGAILEGRYRIIGLLGRGGMGEVYRADDLKLNQPVALKFLPRGLSNDPVRLERFYSEVRIARQVSHPGVCRVYDVAELAGQHFLSMEYVDGEDLSSLLKRIGRLPNDKALEIARQLCAGLAAAHDKGVLHRDLKPANVMIDGRGRARITDFGLAVAAGEVTQGELSGTPLYMAPEQLEGKGASVKSDIYALGLVLYELFTGRKAFQASTLAELKRKKQEEAPALLSEITRDIDPIVERVILRCLERDVRLRPASALSVAAALPGGDPLAAALAAGETPSPEMVAAGGEVEGLRPAIGWACLAAAVVGLIVSALLSDKVKLSGYLSLDNPPDVLAAKAREITKRLGYTATPADEAFGFASSQDYLRYVEKNDKSASRWEALRSGDSPVVFFWHRGSPRDLVAQRGFASQVTPTDPPRELSGMTLAILDSAGSLRHFEAVPPQREDDGKGMAPSAQTPASDWSPLFSLAGLDRGSFRVVEPQWTPLLWGDSRAAWEGSFRTMRSGGASLPAKDLPVRIEAASYRGKPVYFDMVFPWDRPYRMEVRRPTDETKILQTLSLILFIAILVGGLLVARRNLRLGRGDHRSAFRLGVFVLIAFLFEWLLTADHVGSTAELGLFVRSAGQALFLGTVVWLLYIALEPFVRRRWPNTIVSWTRLVSGQFRDPVVGRDILAGVLFGIGWNLISHELLHFAHGWVGKTLPKPQYVSLESIVSVRYFLGEFANYVALYLFGALGIFFVIFLLRVILRKEWLAAAAFGLLMAVPSLASPYPLLDGAFSVVVFASLIFLLKRFGLLAIVFAFLVDTLLRLYPITPRLSAWYAPTGLFALSIVLAFAIYGFWTALGGRPVFGTASLDD